MARHNVWFPFADTRHGAWRWCVLMVLAAFICAQGLGFMHRVAHEGHARSGADVVTSHADWVHALFDLHDDETDCRLYDGLSPQALACGAAPGLPLIQPASADLRELAGEFIARWAAVFDARGPPSSH